MPVNAPNQGGDFRNPSSVAVDRLDNLYVVDSDLRRVMRRNPSGQWERCMPPAAAPGESYEPTGLSFDASNNLYLVERAVTGSRLLQRHPEGDWTLLAESGTGPRVNGGSLTPSEFIDLNKAE